MSHELPPAKPVTQYSDRIPVATLSPSSTPHAPTLSIIVVVYSMPDQAHRTLHSLSSQYQKGVREEDYEVVVVENASSHVLGEADALQHGANYRYLLREETAPTPIHAFLSSVAEFFRLPPCGEKLAGKGVQLRQRLFILSRPVEEQVQEW